ncbi:hypothetical protein Zmor_000422 [Zophobas morio]|uniref:Major facilitator superfamily (MFS) profile domain-containing protein n=1 Tax=Zophobas morio TaxID=2755281 RepID=A0AA38J2R3_9CUCU|nr:hypothetical protein Zmor_000422 [Zophobas morio]
MHRGWSAPAYPKLSSSGITNNDIMWLEAIYFLGELISIPFAAYMVDRIGRKTTILLNTAVGLIAWTIIALSSRVVPFYVARFLAGATGNISMVSVSIYISETANPTSRSWFLGVICFAQNLGTLMVYGLVPYFPFYVPSILANVVLVCQLVVFNFMPESPYYHVLTKRENLARQALSKLRRHDNNDDEISTIKTTIKANESQWENFKGIFGNKRNRKGLLIAVGLYAGLQFGGFSFTLMNVAYIFTKTKSQYLKSSLAEIVFAVLMITGNVLCLLCLNKIGRKNLLLLSLTVSGLFLLGVGVYFTLMDSGLDLASVGWVSTLCITAYAVSFQLGFGSLIEPMSAELFSTKSRALGTTFTNAVDAVFGVLAIVLCNFLVGNFGLSVTYYLFAGVSFLTIVFVGFFVPETDGKSLQEIEGIFET